MSEVLVRQLNFDGTPFYPVLPLELTQESIQPEIVDQHAQPGLLQKLGELPTKAAIYFEIKTADVLEAANKTLDMTKEYLSVESKRKLAHGALLLTLGTGIAGFTLMRESKKAYAATGPQYTVNSAANGGIYSRNTPNWDDTLRIPGQGIYPNDVLTLECGVTDGAPVGQYNNTTWYYVHDNSRDEPDFWMNDHFMDTPNAPGQLAPGVITCPNESSNPMAGASQASDSVPETPYYEGNCNMDNGSLIIESFNNAVDNISGGEDDDKNMLTQWEELWGNKDTFGICVGANLSAPDPHTGDRYISTVQASTGLEPSGCSPAFEVEVWGDGFYKKTDCVDPTQWDINKPLKQGTYVCAAISDVYDYQGFDNQADAEKAVTSGEYQLGSADPYRSITCTEV